MGGVVRVIAARCEAGEIILDGQGPQAGEHMRYRRDGDTLHFTGDFIRQGKPLTVEFEFKRAGDRAFVICG